MEHDTLKELGTTLKGKILSQVSLSRYTSLHVGGIADIMIYPATVQELQTVIRYSRKHAIPYCIMGRGTNLLIKDGGIRGIVIKLSRCCNTIKITETVKSRITLTAGAGVSLKRLLTFAVESSLPGFCCSHSVSRMFWSLRTVRSVNDALKKCRKIPFGGSPPIYTSESKY